MQRVNDSFIDPVEQERIESISVEDVIRTLGVYTSVRPDWPGRRKKQKYIRLAIRTEDDTIEDDYWLWGMRLCENGRRILRKFHNCSSSMHGRPDDGPDLTNDGRRPAEEGIRMSPQLQQMDVDAGNGGGRKLRQFCRRRLQFHYR